MAIIALAVASVHLPPQSVSGDESSNFISHKDFYKGDLLVLSLQFRISQDGHTVCWRVKNHSERPLYDVAIEKKTYKLSNGSTSDVDLEHCGKELVAGGHCAPTVCDEVGHSAKARAEAVSVKSPFIHFRVAPGDKNKRYGASEVLDPK